MLILVGDINNLSKVYSIIGENNNIDKDAAMQEKQCIPLLILRIRLSYGCK